MFSPMLLRVRLVSESMRISPVPTLISALEFLSAQTLSALVNGRLICPAVHSPVPCGCTETDPSMYCRRAARAGASSAGAELVSGAVLVPISADCPGATDWSGGRDWSGAAD